MNARTTVSFSLIAALLAAAPTPVRTADDSSDIAALSRKLRELEEEVATLRQRLSDLGQQPALRLQPAVPQPSAPGDVPVPPGWQPREFNGQRYYVVPLSPGSPRAPQ